MPDFSVYPESDTIKMLYLGDSGSGKTGSLVSLAAAGYNVRIADLDKGAQIIKHLVLDKDSPYRRAHPGLWTAEQAATLGSRISYVSLSEEFTQAQGKRIPRGVGYKKLADLLTRWKDGANDLGPLESWTSRDVLVVDSFSRVCDWAMNFQLVLSGRAASGPQQQDWWPAQNQVKQLLESLTSELVRCNVILICHIDYVERDDKITRGVPQALGQKLGPQIGQLFNNAIMARASGQGAAAASKIFTKTTGIVDLKNTNPLKVKPEYPLETGLAEIFQAVLGPLPALQPLASAK